MRRSLICAVLAITALGVAPVRAEEGGGKKSKQSYVQLQTVAVSTTRPGGLRGVLTVELGLDVPDAALRDKVDLYVPLLRSAYVSALQPYGLGLPPGNPPNADYISITLQRETDRVLGRHGAKLLLGSILVN
jgi:hypothetical protein